jgi:hypothetical protein
MLGGVWSAAERVLVDLRVQIWVVQLAQERRHIGKVGKLVSVPGLWLQSKLDEDISVVDVAQNRAGIRASANPAEHLPGLLV